MKRFAALVASLALASLAFDQLQTGAGSFVGSKTGDTREVAGVKLCWCPPGHFKMGSPPDEPERRLDERQVDVTLTRGFWMGKYEVTQGEWKRIVGKLPGELTADGGAGEDFAVYNMNYAEAETFCRKLTERGRQSGELPPGWEFRLPTEAQWEYACRAGTTTATAFGDKLSNKQANFQGKPYNGAENGPSHNKAVKVGSYPPNAWGLCVMHGNLCEWCRDCTTRAFPEASTRTYRRRRAHGTATAPTRVRAAAVPGATTAGPTVRPSASASNRSAATTTSASASRPCSRSTSPFESGGGHARAIA